MHKDARIYSVGTLKYNFRHLILVFIVLLLAGCGFQALPSLLMVTILPAKLNGMGVSSTLISIMLGSVPAAIGFVLNPILSTVSDRTRTRWGRRMPFMMFALPFIIVFMILLGWAPQIAQHFSWDGSLKGIILVWAVLLPLQIFGLFVGSLYFYLVADVMPAKFMGRFFSASMLLGTTVGFILNYYVLKYAIVHLGWINTCTTLLYFVIFVVMFLVVKEGKYPNIEQENSSSISLVAGIKSWVGRYFKDCFCHKFFLLLFMGTAMTQVSTICRNIFNVLFATKELGLTMEQYGKIMGVSGAVSLGAILIMGYVMDKIDPLLVFICSGIVVIFMNVYGYFFVNSYLTFYGIGICMTAVYAVQGLCTMPMFVELFPPDKFGQFSSANSLLNCMFIIVANFIGGKVIDLFGFRMIFVWDFIFTIIATVILVYVLILKKQQLNEITRSCFKTC